MYIDATPESGQRFFGSEIQGELTMLNMLRFREWADYSSFPDLAPPSPISGRAAFDRYAHHAKPFLEATGGSVIFLGQSSHFLIGPFDERWDLIMLVRQKSKEALLSMASNQKFMAGLGHRTAALVDSRLLPIEDLDAHAMQ